MSNQVFKNQTVKYPLVSGGSAIYQLSANQSIPASTITSVSNLTTLSIDIGLDSFVSNSSGIFTVAVDGLYQFDYTVGWASNTTEERYSFIYFTQYSSGETLNLAETYGPTTPTTGTCIQSGSCLLQCGKGDMFVLKVEQTTVGVLDIVQPTTKMSITKIQ